MGDAVEQPKKKTCLRIAPRPPVCAPFQQGNPFAIPPAAGRQPSALLGLLAGSQAFARGFGAAVDMVSSSADFVSQQKKAERREKKRLAEQARRDRKKKEKLDHDKSYQRDAIRGRILDAQKGDGLDEDALSFLVDMWERGELKDGVDGFGADGCLGRENGLFYALVSTEHAAPRERDGRRSKDESPFWGKDPARLEYTLKVFVACMKAGFLVVIDGDCPTRSVMALCGSAAREKDVDKLGHVGNRAGTSMFPITSKFLANYREGAVRDEELKQHYGNKGCWTIQNSEEDHLCDKKTWFTIRCREACELVHNTRMGGLCYPRRDGFQGGELTEAISREDEEWGGSEFTSFAMLPKALTGPHVDRQMVLGREELLPAAGTMMAIRRDEKGPAKRAIIVCAHDRERVVKSLNLDITKPSSTQYRGKIKDLETLASTLKADGVLFTVAEFPPNCSYAIPRDCVHMFVTLRLVESTAWHPSLKSSIQRSR